MWKQIEGYPNYSVSIEGQVKNNKTGRILTPTFDSNSYQFVILYKDGHRWHGYLHRLVAMAFIDNPKNYLEVNHIDGCKTNNCKSNLEWCDHAQNIQHALRWLGRKRSRGKVKKVLCIETGEVFPNAKAAAVAVGRSYMALYKCLNGQMKTAAGLHWRWVV